MKRGFTLIELSIVLVIIGLIVGGVLVGRDLIEAAAVRATVSQAQETQTAINTFRLKYNCLPGDCKNATTFGFSFNGDGDKVVVDTSEGLWVWTHLGQAELIKGQYDGLWDGDVKVGESYPATPLDKQTGWRVGNVGIPGPPPAYLAHYPAHRQYMFIGIYNGTYYAQPGAVFPPIAYQIDQKIDDGAPKTGKVMVWDNAGCQSAGAYLTIDGWGGCNPSVILDW